MFGDSGNVTAHFGGGEKSQEGESQEMGRIAVVHWVLRFQPQWHSVWAERPLTPLKILYSVLSKCTKIWLYSWIEFNWKQVLGFTRVVVIVYEQRRVGKKTQCRMAIGLIGNRDAEKGVIRLGSDLYPCTLVPRWYMVTWWLKYILVGKLTTYEGLSPSRSRMEKQDIGRIIRGVYPDIYHRPKALTLGPL